MSICLTRRDQINVAMCQRIHNFVTIRKTCFRNRTVSHKPYGGAFWAYCFFKTRSTFCDEIHFPNSEQIIRRMKSQGLLWTYYERWEELSSRNEGIETSLKTLSAYIGFPLWEQEHTLYCITSCRFVASFPDLSESTGKNHATYRNNRTYFPSCLTNNYIDSRCCWIMRFKYKLIVVYSLKSF